MTKKGLVPKKNITQVIEEVIKEFGDAPYEINNGRCDEFAFKVQEVIPRATVWETPLNSKYPTHLWIEYKGKHYDAECPNGVEDFRELPIFSPSRNFRLKLPKSKIKRIRYDSESPKP